MLTIDAVRGGSARRTVLVVAVAGAFVAMAGCSAALNWGDTGDASDIPTCGDETADPGEECDTLDLRGNSCVSRGYATGQLRCTANCLFDETMCVNPCGDGLVQGTEQCDDGNQDVSDDCPDGPRGTCQLARCGDGLKHATNESCDGSDFGSATCSSLGFVDGPLTCLPDCQIDTSACSTCGNGVCEDHESQYDCQADCGAIQLQAGASHNCVLLADRTVRCWGRNSFQQLGFDTSPDSQSWQPVRAADLTGVQQITVGNAHNCALLEDESVVCWGNNNEAELGNVMAGAETAVPTPVVGLPGPVQAIGAGYFNTCAVLTTGAVYCWGANNASESSGDGNPSTVDVVAPNQISGITNAIAIVGGWGHMCALLNTGRAKCWGGNHRGQCGTGGTCATTNCPVSDVHVNLNTGRLMTAGDSHTCAIYVDGKLTCWGDNTSGQLGDGNRGTHRDAPGHQVMPGGLHVDGGEYFTCAVNTSGAVSCWGYGGYGALGLAGDYTTYDLPQPVVGLSSGAVQVAAGFGHACARMDDGTVQCWGYNWGGQAGVDPATDPVETAMPTPAW